jgi:hypothetical protein
MDPIGSPHSPSEPEPTDPSLDEKRQKIRNSIREPLRLLKDESCRKGPLSARVCLGTPDKLPLIKNIMKALKFDKPSQEAPEELLCAIERSCAPPRQMHAWELIRNHSHRIQNEGTDYLQKHTHYRQQTIKTSDGETTGAFQGSEPLIVHGTPSRYLKTIIGQLPKPGSISRQEMFILNQADKIAASHYLPGHSITSPKSRLYIILKADPEAIVDIAAEDIETPVMGDSEGVKNYLIFCQKANHLSLYVNTILQHTHVMLDKDLLPSEASQAHLTAKPGTGLLARLINLKNKLQSVPLDTRQQFSKELFNKNSEADPLPDLLKIIDQLGSSIDATVEELKKRATGFGAILLKHQVTALAKTDHAYGPRELSQISTYSELTIRTTRLQDPDADPPRLEVAAIGIPLQQLSWDDTDLCWTTANPDIEAALKEARGKGLSVIILSPHSDEC